MDMEVRGAAIRNFTLEALGRRTCSCGCLGIRTTPSAEALEARRWTCPENTTGKESIIRIEVDVENEKDMKRTRSGQALGQALRHGRPPRRWSRPIDLQQGDLREQR
jgi:hypothetical protein